MREKTCRFRNVEKFFHFLPLKDTGDSNNQTYFAISLIIEEMFYSPKKNIEAFIEAKNEEIKALKQKILGTRITYQEMGEAKERLDKLKASHILLEKEDHLELKDLLNTTQQAITDLTAKKNAALQELESRRKDVEEMGDLRDELTTKKKRTEELHKEVTDVKDKLVDRKEKKNQQILELQEEIEMRRKQIQMELSISDELSAAREEMMGKNHKARKELAEKCDENRLLKEAIRQELEAIDSLEHGCENNELRIENIGLKISNEEKQIQNYQHKIESAKTFLQRVAEDKLTLIKQCETAANVDALLKMVTETSQCRQKEQDECSSVIKDTQNKIQRANIKRKELQRQVLEKQQNLKEMKQKGIELKSILNSIFHEDSSVLKLLADKKVHDEPMSSSKVSTEEPNSPDLNQIKHDMMEMMATSDNFFMTNS